jgi:hypothetical protein
MAFSHPFLIPKYGRTQQTSLGGSYSDCSRRPSLTGVDHRTSPITRCGKIYLRLGLSRSTLCYFSDRVVAARASWVLTHQRRLSRIFPNGRGVEVRGQWCTRLVSHDSLRTRAPRDDHRSMAVIQRIALINGINAWCIALKWAAYKTTGH